LADVSGVFLSVIGVSSVASFYCKSVDNVMAKALTFTVLIILTSWDSVNVVIYRLLISCKEEEKRDVEKFSAFDCIGNKKNVSKLMIGRVAYAVR
jgi:hypothetical protein